MKVAEAVERIDAGWIRKPAGFRVQFDIYADGLWRTDCSPEQSDPPLDSAVTVWRFAWKLAQTSEINSAPYKDGDLANIYVIDDQGTRIPSYITGHFDVYHPQEELNPQPYTEETL